MPEFLHKSSKQSMLSPLRTFTTTTFILVLVACISGFTQDEPTSEKESANAEEPQKKWFETFSIRGYVQVRYNRLFETNPDLKCDQCDRSWGENGGFFLRRVRVIFSGQISKRIYFYVQPDFATSTSSGLNFAQLRDAYFDIGFDDKNEYRIRIGQTKIPYGFENMQSSQVRLPLDRSDGINSSLINERDIGMIFYWAPEEKRKLFADLVKNGLKGSGDYGIFAFGVYNGNAANKPDQNNEPHVVTRFTYPVKIGKQTIEAGIQAYTGKYTLPEDQLSPGVKTNENRTYTDQRIAASFSLYTNPVGIQAEYNIGKGPEYNPATDSVETKNLHGGYITLSYLLKTKGGQMFIPFVRYQYYDGGKRYELDARSYNVREFEVGMEWQPIRQFELVAMYTISSRRFEDSVKPNNLQEGNLLRLQAQLNF